MPLPAAHVVMEEVTDRDKIEQAQAQHERYERNLAWLNSRTTRPPATTRIGADRRSWRRD